MARRSRASPRARRRGRCPRRPAPGLPRCGRSSPANAPRGTAWAGDYRSPHLIHPILQRFDGAIVERHVSAGKIAVATLEDAHRGRVIETARPGARGIEEADAANDFVVREM